MKQLFLGYLLLASYQTVLAQPLTARQLIDKTYAAYRAADTYQDTGEEITSIKRGNAPWYEPETITFTKPFQTAYVRRTAQYTLRYKRGISALRHPEECSLIWARGAAVKTWLDIHKKVEMPPTLENALGLSWGIPGNAVNRVYSLLLNKPLNIWSLNELKGVNVLPTDKVLNRTCYHLRGTLNRKVYGHVRAKAPRPVIGPTESHPAIDVWIDATTFLIVRLTESYKQGVDVRTETITWQPVVNQSVRPEVLAFDYSKCP